MKLGFMQFIAAYCNKRLLQLTARPFGLPNDEFFSFLGRMLKEGGGAFSIRRIRGLGRTGRDRSCRDQP